MYIVLYLYETTAAEPKLGVKNGPSPLFSFFLWRCRKKQLLCPAAEFVLRDYTVSNSGSWQGFVVSHTYLDNMADLLIWHGVHLCHLITGRILISKRQLPNVRETDGDRERRYIWGERKKWNESPDRWCSVIDEQCKAIHFTPGASFDRLELAHRIEVISHMFNSSYTPS